MVEAFCGHGIKIDRDAIPVLPETVAICEHFQLNPLGLLASGCLLAVLEPDEAIRYQKSVERNLRYTARIIGELTEEKTCLWHGADDPPTPIPEFSRDEISRVLED